MLTGHRDAGTPSFDARVATSAVVILAGPFLALAAFLTWIGFWKSESSAFQAAAVCLGGAVIWLVWLRGFRIIISGGQFTYRSGMYKTTSIPLREITSAEQCWVEARNFGSVIKIPRLAIKYIRMREPLLVNVKPFR